ncbi:hypothetical protein CP10139811_0572 [Chlamydia ibidis]|uniref:Uncharacterized protein n=2 Tax=Chlamydia ibidis TaxID=1405396 RepID=S7J462_9CHLA|nr:hypothetical protein CP10139811_0572 [Chlamydia ibidis]EQM62481.1 hypothetical protein H359_0952 [Chlamydia ibidis 10-1398/6]
MQETSGNNSQRAVGTKISTLKVIYPSAWVKEYLGPGEKSILSKLLAMGAHCFLSLS